MIADRRLICQLNIDSLYFFCALHIKNSPVTIPAESGIHQKDEEASSNIPAAAIPAPNTIIPAPICPV